MNLSLLICLSFENLGERGRPQGEKILGCLRPEGRIPKIYRGRSVQQHKIFVGATFFGLPCLVGKKGSWGCGRSSAFGKTRRRKVLDCLIYKSGNEAATIRYF